MQFNRFFGSLQTRVLLQIAILAPGTKALFETRNEAKGLLERRQKAKNGIVLLVYSRIFKHSAHVVGPLKTSTCSGLRRSYGGRRVTIYLWYCFSIEV